MTTETWFAPDGSIRPEAIVEAKRLAGMDYPASLLADVAYAKGAKGLLVRPDRGAPKGANT